MNGIHLSKGSKLQPGKITIRSPDEDSTLPDLALVALSRFEFHLPFQVDVAGTEDSHFDIGIK